MQIVIAQKCADEIIKELSVKLGVSEDFAQLLYNRGINDVETARKFLYDGYENLSSPYVYSGMNEAVEIIRKHVKSFHRIVFYGDYDCDGVSAVSILIRAFADKGIKCNYYIPVRQEEGYGININAVKKIKAEINPQLIITVDCGITSRKEIELAKSLGIEVIVTDHHTAGEELPECTVLDPVLDSGTCPLCGAGMAFTLIRALFGDDFAKNYVDICGIATIADIVPLIGDNRIIVKNCLETIRSGNCKVGIKELITSAGIDRRQLTSYDIGFKIAPRLNASGRLNVAHSSVRLLITDDVTEARFLSEELGLQNSERQEIGKRIYEEAKESLNGYNFAANPIIIVKAEGWNEGVIGIAAAKITEYFYRPAILMTESKDGIIKGSARSISEINIVELISTQKDKLLAFGGHAMAAGLSMEKSRFEAFFAAINAEARKCDKEIFRRNVRCELELPAKSVTDEFVKEIEKLEPHGFKNPSPVFCDTNPEIKFSRIGTSNHAKGRTKAAEAVCFSKWNKMEAFSSSSEKKMVYVIGKNCFNGFVTNQLNVKKLIFKDFCVAEATLSANFARFSNAIGELKNYGSAKDRNGDKLHVFFDGDLYSEFMKEHPNVNEIYISQEEFEFGDSAVLSPSVDFPFGYYGEITVYGKVTQSMRRFFDSLGAEYVKEDVCGLLTEFSVDGMREAYKFIRKLSETKFNGVSDLFKRCQKLGLSSTEEYFIIYFYVLTDVELIKIDDSGILIVNNSKTDITKSPIYGYIYG